MKLLDCFEIPVEGLAETYETQVLNLESDIPGYEEVLYSCKVIEHAM